MKAKSAKATRRKDAPTFPKPKAKKAPTTKQATRMTRLRTIVAKARAWRVTQDAFIAGADMRSLEEYPTVFYPTGIAPKPPGLRRVVSDHEDDPEEIEVAPRTPIAPPVPLALGDILAIRPRSKEVQSPIAPPVDFGERRVLRCNDCGVAGHNRTRCPDRFSAAEWERIDREIANAKTLRQASLRLGMDLKTLRARLRARADVQATLTKRASAAQQAEQSA